MVEIISRGRLPEENNYHASCNNCNTHFKFKRSEASASGDQRDPGYSISCPLCHKMVWMTALRKYNG